MENITVETLTLAGFIAGLPTVIIYLTNQIKNTGRFGAFTFLIPLSLGVLLMGIAWIVFGEISLPYALLLGLWVGIHSIMNYNESVKGKSKVKEVASSTNDLPNELGQIPQD